MKPRSFGIELREDFDEIKRMGNYTLTQLVDKGRNDKYSPFLTRNLSYDLFQFFSYFFKSSPRPAIFMIWYQSNFSLKITNYRGDEI